MATPSIARTKGYHHELKAGQVYLWCSCGRSAKQPFCDGSHQGTSFRPTPYRAARDEEVIFCGCKHTAAAPFCDGAHNDLPGASPADDPASPANSAVQLVAPSSNPITRLDGDCYVFSPARAKLSRRGALAYCAVLIPERGAEYQSQFYAELGAGASPVIGADGRHTVVFIADGEGELEIGDRRFPLAPPCGAYIGPDEVFRVHNTGGVPLRMFISNRPGAEDLCWRDQLSPAFDAAFPERVAAIDPRQRQSMADRYFQVLVNREQGSTELTQFIGNIPVSKGKPHRHLYEEAIIVLRGAGTMWTETRKAAVGAGEVLFLPRKQLHSLQCNSPGGMDVVGLICPGDNPAVNY